MRHSNAQAVRQIGAQVFYTDGNPENARDAEHYFKRAGVAGRVTRKARDADTRGIQQFNRLAYASRELYPVILPLRDGVLVARKL